MTHLFFSLYTYIFSKKSIQYLRPSDKIPHITGNGGNTFLSKLYEQFTVECAPSAS